MFSFKPSKHRCNCFGPEYSSFLYGLRRDAPSTDRVLLERLLNVLSRAAARGSKNPQRLWVEDERPEWWAEVTELKWKNPREHPKDTKDTLRKKIDVLEKGLRKQGKMTKELQEELVTHRESKKIDLELKSDFEAAITKASGLHYMLDKAKDKMVRSRIVSEKIAKYIGETKKCLEKSLVRVNQMQQRVVEQEEKRSSLWVSMGVSKRSRTDASEELDTLPAGKVVASSDSIYDSSSLSPDLLNILSPVSTQSLSPSPHCLSLPPSMDIDTAATEMEHESHIVSYSDPVLSSSLTTSLPSSVSEGKTVSTSSVNDPGSVKPPKRQATDQAGKSPSAQESKSSRTLAPESPVHEKANDEQSKSGRRRSPKSPSVCEIADDEQWKSGITPFTKSLTVYGNTDDEQSKSGRTQSPECMAVYEVRDDNVQIFKSWSAPAAAQFSSISVGPLIKAEMEDNRPFETDKERRKVRPKHRQSPFDRPKSSTGRDKRPVISTEDAPQKRHSAVPLATIPSLTSVPNPVRVSGSGWTRIGPMQSEAEARSARSSGHLLLDGSSLATDVTVDCEDAQADLDGVEAIIEVSDTPTVSMYGADASSVIELTEMAKAVSLDDISPSVLDPFISDLSVDYKSAPAALSGVSLRSSGGQTAQGRVTATVTSLKERSLSKAIGDLGANL